METGEGKSAIKEKARKKKFVEKMGELVTEFNPNVEGMRYYYFEDIEEEWVDIQFDGGGHCAICVTATSIMAIGREIMENVMHSDYSQNDTFNKIFSMYWDRWNKMEFEQLETFAKMQGLIGGVGDDKR